MPADLDLFDDYYEHLFIWQAEKREIVGAYRLGRSDTIRKRFGARGLYLTSLFEFREPFFTLLGPALELGRSFVRSEYQRSYAPLLLLWKGISEYIGRHPEYARVIGAASVSNTLRSAVACAAGGGAARRGAASRCSGRWSVRTGRSSRAIRCARCSAKLAWMPTWMHWVR